MPDSEKSGTFTSYWIVAPAVGAAVALTFDVGYFLGLDINLFTLFSISEHIVFALQALPIALALVAGLLSGAFSGYLGYLSGKGMTTDDREKNRTQRIPFFIFFAVTLFVFAALFLYFEQYPQATACATLAILMSTVTFTRTLNLSLLLFSLVVFFIIMSFAFGIDRAYKDISSTERLHLLTTDEGRYRGRVIRSGERGVLFFSPDTKTLSLLKWDSIKQIVSFR